MRWMTVIVETTAITQSTGAMRSNVPPIISSTEALGTFHEADFAGGNQRLGTGARITHHNRSGSGHGRQNDVGSPSVDRIIDKQPHVQGHIGITIESGIEKSAKCRDAPLAASHLAVEHIQKSRKKDHRCG